MKIKRTKAIKTYQFLEFHLTKTQNNNQRNNIFLNEETRGLVKNALTLIAKFTRKNKKILFMGFPEEELNQIMLNQIKQDQNQHLFIPEFEWVNGAITNRKNIDYAIKTKKIDSNITKLIKKIRNGILYQSDTTSTVELIVIFNVYNSEQIIKESKRKKIPVINFTENQNSLNEVTAFTDFSIPLQVNFKDSKTVSFIISLLLALIKHSSPNKQKTNT